MCVSVDDALNIWAIVGYWLFFLDSMTLRKNLNTSSETTTLARVQGSYYNFLAKSSALRGEQQDRESRQIESFNEANRPTNTTCHELGNTIQCATY